MAQMFPSDLIRRRDAPRSGQCHTYSGPRKKLGHGCELAVIGENIGDEVKSLLQHGGRYKDQLGEGFGVVAQFGGC